jgi:hypothetical protein
LPALARTEAVFCGGKRTRLKVQAVSSKESNPADPASSGEKLEDRYIGLDGSNRFEGLDCGAVSGTDTDSTVAGLDGIFILCRPSLDDSSSARTEAIFGECLTGLG